MFLSKLKTLLLYAPAFAFFGICPNELKTYVHIKTHSQIFIGNLFIIAKSWRQSRCPSVNKWIKKLSYIYIMKYHSDTQNEFSVMKRTRGMSRWKIGIFKILKLFCMILEWWIYVIVRLSKPIECTTQRISPNINYGL